ncbi:penicillin-binding protein activator LpoB [Myroides pelagicus]|uniref:Penicillin-binding protein activator LpoB n=1 Tax=Myroides pelagicus TaxID=270914 RepID=A0A7K1GI45_9FLAO|nr:penicillin-binding protein activator LpoB [Myroides pelagicus]MEC4112535.1 penicillin-binding protein activator LpoB [Myroides pelagicus]MTH28546.1 penicillin-binding protein activator LpoB [Myroides pelagicus]
MQMKRIALAAILAVSGLFISSCGRQVTRVSTDETIDISGRWNNTDSREVAQQMTRQIMEGPWIYNFQDENEGKRPVVIVGMVYNKSHEHIEAETFVKDIEQAFIQTQRVRLVQGGKKREELRGERADQQTNASVSSMKKFGLEQGADFMLQGSINSIVDAHKKQKVVYYQVNLELTNIQTNEVVWVGDKKIAKYVKR